MNGRVLNPEQRNKRNRGRSGPCLRCGVHSFWAYGATQGRWVHLENPDEAHEAEVDESGYR